MEARELRIGNNFMFGELIHTIKPCDILNLYQKELAGENCDPYKPIPLTEDWLKKLGFIDKDYTMELKAKRKKLTVEWYLRNVSTGVRSGWYFNKYRHIKYVHQLQNLYFAITGEELKII